MKNGKLLKTLACLTVGAAAAVGCLGITACGDDHKHSYGTDYGKDATGHWQVCTDCEEQSKTVAHSYDGDADTTCNVCGYVRTVNGDTNQGGTNQGGTNQGGTSTEKGTHTYTYDYSLISKKADKATLSQADFTGANSFLTVGSGVTYRLNKEEPLCIEVKGGGLQVTFAGTGKITITFGSTSGSNTSGLALLKADGSYVDGTSSVGTKLSADDANGNKAGLITVTGGQNTKSATPATVEYTVSEAGTYTIWCSYSYLDAGETKSRGGRIWSISMTDTVA